MHSKDLSKEKAPFSSDDPLYLLVSKADDAVHHLSVTVHYLACDAARRKPEN